MTPVPNTMYCTTCRQDHPITFVGQTHPVYEGRKIIKYEAYCIMECPKGQSTVSGYRDMK